jgi:hypothetical protein
MLISIENDSAIVEEPMPGSPFKHLGRSFDFYADEPVMVSTVDLPSDRWPKELFLPPALVVLGLVVWLQLRRRRAAVSS